MAVSNRMRRAPTSRHLRDRLLIWAALLALVAALGGSTPRGGHAASPRGRQLVGHTAAVNSVALSSDGAVLASSSADGTIRIWDVATGRVRRVLVAGQWAGWVAFTPDGSTLLGVGSSGSRDTEIESYIKFWDTRDWSLTQSIRGGGRLAVSPDGKLLATTEGYVQRLIKLRDLRSGRVIRTLVGHEGLGVNSLAFSPGGRRLVSGGGDSTLRIWDVPSGALQRVITRNDTGRIGTVNSVAWSPDGQTIASASGTAGTLDSDTHITLWDAATGLVKRHLGQGDGQFIQVVSFSHNGRLVAGGTVKFIEVGVWDVQTGEQIHSYRGNRGFITSLAFSPDGRLLASASNDPVIWLWSLYP